MPLGRFAAEALGISDIGKIVRPQDYDKTDADDYVMNEDNEQIYFLIKSKTDEYCFTNLALIHVDGTSALSKKRLLRRYNYFGNMLSDVYLETAGTVDLDVEIKFTLGQSQYSIDVHKDHLEELKDLYKALIKISEINAENNITLDYARRSLETASTTLGRASSRDVDVVDQFKQINDFAFNWLSETRNQYRVKDFGFVFEKYINN